MQAPFELTVGQAKLAQIISERPVASEFWNEAQNRFQFIDRLLTECLGWTRPYISVEQPDGGGGKIDYVLGSPVKAILEAKREAAQFQLPPNANPTLVRKLQPMIRSCKVLEQRSSRLLVTAH